MAEVRSHRLCLRWPFCTVRVPWSHIVAAGTGWKHKMAALCRAIGKKIAQRKKPEMTERERS